MTASLVTFPGLFSVLWPISVILQFRWSRFVLRFPTLPIFYQAFGDRFRAPTTTGITFTLLFFSFLIFLARSNYLSLFSISLIFTLWSAGTAKSTIHQVLFLLLFFCLMLIFTRSSLLVGIRLSVCFSKSLRILCISFFRTDSGLCIYHLVVWSDFNFFRNSQWISFSTQSCLDLHSLCASLPTSVIMWLLVSSLSLHNLHLLFYCAFCPVGWGSRIHRLHLCWEVRPSPDEFPKQSDGEVPMIFELWEYGASLHCHRSQVHSSPE